MNKCRMGRDMLTLQYIFVGGGVGSLTLLCSPSGGITTVGVLTGDFTAMYRPGYFSMIRRLLFARRDALIIIER